MTHYESRADYDEVVRAPGKFEGEQPYVPYFYEMWNDGFADEDFGRSAVFTATPNACRLFPDLLKEDQRIGLYERDDGFVCECEADNAQYLGE